MKYNLETKVIEKGRVMLRPLVKTDASFILKLRSDSHNMRFVNMKIYENLERAERFIDAVVNDITLGSICFWGLGLVETKEMIGTVCLWNVSDDMSSAEIGYELLSEHQGYGYMREAVEMVIEYAFTELEFARIDAVTHKDHLSSLSLLSHLGFLYQGYVKNVFPESEDEPDMIVYRLFRSKKWR